MSASQDKDRFWCQCYKTFLDQNLYFYRLWKIKKQFALMLGPAQKCENILNNFKEELFTFKMA